MIICHEHKFIYIHVPRTGGHSVKKMWKKYDSYIKFYHMTLKDNIKQDINSYFKFGFIRNPYERIYSIFCKHNKESKVNTSNGFKYWMFDTDRTDNRHDKLSAMYFLDGVDYIAKYENFEKEWDYIFEQIEIPRQQLPHIFKFKDYKISYRDLYDNKMKNFIQEYHSADFKQGYIF